MRHPVRIYIRVLIGLVLVGAGVVTAAVAIRPGADGSGAWRPAKAPRSEAVPDAATVRYEFDGAGEAAWSDASGNGHLLTPVTGNDARLARASHGTGSAVRFPLPCDGAERCPRLALRAPSADALNPGIRKLRFGASILLEPAHTSSGQNVLQKGFSTEGSQYKLQIDGRAGRPSCTGRRRRFGDPSSRR